MVEKVMRNYLALLACLLTSLSLELGHVAGTSQLPRIRGIPASKNSLYQPNQDFECLDGSLLVPFSSVNDDYCDCGDGSDEPGTSACSNGSFYCQNAGHQANFIPSRWVGDGVCDCCDGSDEFNSNANCVDNCRELGREARLEARKAAQLAKDGNKIRLEMIAKGKQMKAEFQTKLLKLRSDFVEADMLKKEREIMKRVAEEKEAGALEKYKPAEPEAQPGDETSEDEKTVEAEDYFRMLDSDESGTLTINELQVRNTFDRNRDGQVSEEEALFFMNNLNEITMKEFVDDAWRTIKPFVMLEKGIFKYEKDQETGHPGEVEEVVNDQEPEEQEEELATEEEELQDEEETGHIEEPPHDDDEKDIEQEVEGPKYDEETQALIDEATKARDQLHEAEKGVNELTTEIRQLEDKLDRDYGLDDEYYPLDNECFDFEDLEYVYSLCLFNKATQKPKSGGSDVNLGFWNNWAGSEANKYSHMKFDRGLTCWNGPARSVLVTVSCGKENQLISVIEPSRCEYAMEFLTPAACTVVSETVEDDTHDEL